MYTITFYPKARPSLDEGKHFVQSFPEGDWVADTPIHRGVIETDDARVYLDYDDRYRDYYDEFLDDQQRRELTERLGFSPLLALHVHASTVYQHSRELAQAICAKLTTQWGGGCCE